MIEGHTHIKSSSSKSSVSTQESRVLLAQIFNFVANKSESLQMMNHGHILIVNPGSTSTKLAIYGYDIEKQQLSAVDETILNHSGLDASIEDQLNIRYVDVDHFLSKSNVKIQIIMAR